VSEGRQNSIQSANEVSKYLYKGEAKYYKPLSLIFSMQPIYIILTSIIIGAIIGYFTNAVAIYMLFHPHTPKLGGLFHGVIPKRKDKLAENIAKHINLILPPVYTKFTKIPIIGEKIDTALKKSIEKTIRETSNEDLEILIKKVIRKELRFIEISGGILGGLIGTIQGLLFLYL